MAFPRFSGWDLETHNIFQGHAYERAEAHPPVGLIWLKSSHTQRTWSCTGTLVGEDLLLTVGHCLIECIEESHYSDDDANEAQYCKDKKPEVVDLTQVSVQFVANYSAEESAHNVAVGIEKIWTGTLLSKSEKAKDWAVLRLSVPVGTSHEFQTKNGAQKGYGFYKIARRKWSQAPAKFPVNGQFFGYPLLFKEGFELAADTSCALRGLSESAYLRSDCALSAGASGGPFLVPSADAKTFEVLSIAGGQLLRAGQPVVGEAYSDEYSNYFIDLNPVLELMDSLKN